MKLGFQIKAGRFVSTVVALLGGAFIAYEGHATENCQGPGPQICVDFTDGGNPQFPADFLVNFSDPQNPALTLIKGSLFWQVRSRVSASDNTPANIGSIKLNPSVDTDNFGVKIANGASAGAANVGSILLDRSVDPAWTGHASLAMGSHITGNLTGDVVVVQDASGNGGEVEFVVDGNVSGPLRIQTRALGTVALISRRHL